MSLARTFTVTVANPGSGNRYYLDGVLQATAYLGVSGTYRFDQSDSSNAGHPLRFSNNANNDPNDPYTTGVTTNGTPGSAGAYTEIAVTSSTPTTLYYYCQIHYGMGSDVNITSDSWSALEWNLGSWQNQNDSLTSITGSEVTMSVGTTEVAFGINAGWNNAQWGAGPWNEPGTSAFITGQELTSSLGAVVANAEIRTGWSRLAWGDAPWNEAPDVFQAITTAGELSVAFDFGEGWSREEWSSGNWNERLGLVNTGNGNVFSISTFSPLTASLNNVSVFGNAPITISGQQLTVSEGNIDANGISRVTITGTNANVTVNTFAVQAGGAITISTPGFEANVEVNNITVGTANFIEITGQDITISDGTVSAISSNIIEVDGIQSNTTANTISIRADQFFNITGNNITLSLSNVVPNSENFLSINGLQANADVRTLKFWDPISDNSTENWTNI